MHVEELYNAVIDAWNKRDADRFGDLFILDGDLVGFDGTQVTGRGTIVEHLRAIFSGHPTPAYVTKISGVTTLTTDVAIVRAIAGMAPPGTTDLDPKLTSVHRLTAVYRGADWRAALLHTTPARLDGRPDEVAKMTAELQSIT